MTDPEWQRHAHTLYQHGSARLSNRAENSGSRTVCNRAVPYQAHVEIQLEPFPTVLRTVRPDSAALVLALRNLYESLLFLSLREDLLNIRLNIVVGAAVALIKRRTCRRGKRASVLLKLSADLECRYLASIWRISALYPTKRMNSFCSPGQIRIF